MLENETGNWESRTATREKRYTTHNRENINKEKKT